MPDSVPDFTGKLDEYLAWAAVNSPYNPMWCPRHWAPCPVGGLNGILASIIITAEAFVLLPDDVTDYKAINSWWANTTTPACCQFGDEKMAKLWRVILRIMKEEVCGELPPKKPGFQGRHACFYECYHKGAHEWAYPVASVFDLPD